MSHSLPVSASVAGLAFGFIARLFRKPAPGAARAAANDDVWSLYGMSRGRDSVSPAVLSKLAEKAAA